jgi:kynurenine formamidase
VEPVDLTLEISSKLPSFPGSPRPQFISWADIKSDGYNLELIFLSSHSGTHLDAPYHFIEKGLKIDKIPLSRLITSAFLCNIRKGADEPITKNDIVRFETKHGEIPPNSAIIFGTGWSKNTSRKDYFTRNPGLSAGAASYLSERKPSMIGIDSPSIDLGKDSEFSAHHILLKKNILVLENLCNLDKIKRVVFRLAVLPLKLKDATGSPVRAVAI